MKIDGSCHCGQITYKAEVKPEYVVICHCTDCQTISGAPYRVNVPVLPKNFHLRGQPKIYLKTGDSGQQRATAFCSECGAAIYSRKVHNAQYLNLRCGAIRQRSHLIPRSQGFCRSAMPWAMDISLIPQVDPPPSDPRQGMTGAT